MTSTIQAPVSKKFGIYSSKDCKDGRDMLKAAGADFTIEKRQVSYQKIDTTAMPIGMNGDQPVFPTVHVPINSFAAVRSDNGEAVSDRTIGDGYVVLQNEEMIDIATAICTKHDMTFQFMAVLGGGRGLALQVDCPGLSDKLNVGKDQNRANLTMVDWHDGTGSLRMFFSLIRLFCKNRLPAMGREFLDGKRANRLGFYSISHTEKMADRIERAVATIHKATGDLEDTAELMKKLAGIRCTKAERNKMFELIANPEGKDEREMTQRGRTMLSNRRAKLEDAAAMGINQVEDAAGSWYEALQGVTYYGTHGQTVKGGEMKCEDEKRFELSTMGNGLLTNMRAIEIAMEMAGISL